MKRNKTLITSIVTLAILFILASVADLSQVMAQVPPPQLPGAPDQSTLFGSMAIAFVSLFYGVWKLKKR